MPPCIIMNKNAYTCMHWITLDLFELVSALQMLFKYCYQSRKVKNRIFRESNHVWVQTGWWFGFVDGVQDIKVEGEKMRANPAITEWSSSIGIGYCLLFWFGSSECSVQTEFHAEQHAEQIFMIMRVPIRVLEAVNLRTAFASKMQFIYRVIYINCRM